MHPISEMLEPFSEVRPCGEDLGFSGDFDAIAQARRYDDPSLDQGEWVTEIKEADWQFVVERTRQLINSRSKDLRLAVWFAEAGAKTHGFKGLSDGYTLIAGLCDRFWDDLYPLAEDGDQEQRIGNLTWLLSRSTQLLREIPLTEGRNTAYSLADFEAARIRALQAEKALAEGLPAPAGIKLADIESARRKNSRAFMEKMLADCRVCQEALTSLEHAVDARLGTDGPGFSGARRALEEVTVAISRFAQDLGVKNAVSGNAVTGAGVAISADPGDAIDGASTPAVSTPTGAAAISYAGHTGIQTRHQALAQLREVADYFRRTEPHSPVAYLAEKAADWGDLPLHAWLKAVIKDGASLAHVEELLGVPPAESRSD